MNNYKLRSGFTLIEILVVISIIGILTAVISASFMEARQNARNKSVQSELKEVQLAIELYKAQNGRYPSVTPLGCTTTSGGVASARSSACGFNPIINGLVPDFIATLPARSDSGNTNCDYIYQVEAADGAWYKLTAANCFAGADDASEGIQSDDEFARCLSTCPAVSTCDPDSADFYESYSVYSVGGECQ